MTELDVETCTLFIQYGEFGVDDRRPPDGRRRGQFRNGWGKARNGPDYGVRPLQKLTWNNLGYRFARAHPEDSDDGIDAAYKLFAEEYERNGPARLAGERVENL